MSQGFVIKNIRLKNFRNYDNYSRCFEEGVNKIIGPNATGKTNIIEAIGLMTQISSFKNSQISELINKNSSGGSLQIEVEISDNDTGVQNDFVLSVRDGKKIYSLNGKNKSISDCKGRFPSVIFNPDDLALVKGSNTMRREAVDNLGSQISRDYYIVAKDYAKALKQKNQLLRDGASIDLLKSINDVLTVCGAQLAFYRVGLVNKILPVIANYYNEIAGDDEALTIEYFPSWSMDDKISSLTRDDARAFLAKAFDENLNEEIARCRALIGPHRDRIVFVLNGSDAQNFASQGQQRSIVLALKLTEVKLIEDLLDKRPILLLDDVMSELDSSRKTKLLNFINTQTQTFLTST